MNLKTLKHFNKLNETDKLKYLVKVAHLIETEISTQKQIDLIDYFNKINFLNDKTITRPCELAPIIAPVEQKINQELNEHNFHITTKDEENFVTKKKIPVSFILHDIRSSLNVGSIIRSADSLAINKIFFTGFSPNLDNQKVQKTSLGADQFVVTETHQDIFKLLNTLKNNGHKIIALETVKGATFLKDYVINKNDVFILGNERYGISKEVLKEADEILKISQLGHKNSMNVANVMSIVSYKAFECLQKLL